MITAGLVLAIPLSAHIIARRAAPVLLRLNVARGRVDHPGGRKTQPAAVPYGLGLAVFVGFSAPVLLGLALAAVHAEGGGAWPDLWTRHAPGLLERASQVGAVLLGAASLLLMGRIDDRRGLSVGLRLCWQLVAAALVAAAGARVTLFQEASWLHVVMTTAWIVFVTNAFNFIDNMDGLLLGCALAAALSLLVLAAIDGQLFVAAFALALAGALTGVLPFNLPPAKAYMGDEGSMFVGFLVACLTVVISFRPERDGVGGADALPVVLPMLVLLVPIADAGLVTLDRIRRGRSPFRGGTDHLSHRLARRGWGRSGATLLLVGAAFLSGAVAIALVGAPTRCWAPLLGAIGCWSIAWRVRHTTSPPPVEGT